MYKLYKYTILVGGDGYTVSVEKPPIVLGSPVYTRYVEQPIYFGSYYHFSLLLYGLLIFMMHFCFLIIY